MRRPSVLFVCLGNICRSPLAEAAFRMVAEEAGLDAHVDSAGTAAYHVGEPPDPRSIATAAAKGVDICQYRGRQITSEDFTRFTHIFAMDHQNLRNIEAILPSNGTAHVALLMDAVEGREGSAIADPYYDGGDMFDATWADVEAAARALVSRLMREVA